jgi:hypothetical protein
MGESFTRSGKLKSSSNNGGNTGLPVNSPGSHRPDGPKASHGLTFKLDQITEAGQIRTRTLQIS